MEGRYAYQISRSKCKGYEKEIKMLKVGSMRTNARALDPKKC